MVHRIWLLFVAPSMIGFIIGVVVSRRPWSTRGVLVALVVVVIVLHVTGSLDHLLISADAAEEASLGRLA